MDILTGSLYSVFSATLKAYGRDLHFQTFEDLTHLDIKHRLVWNIRESRYPDSTAISASQTPGAFHNLPIAPFAMIERKLFGGDCRYSLVICSSS